MTIYCQVCGGEMRPMQDRDAHQCDECGVVASSYEAVLLQEGRLRDLVALKDRKP